MKRIYKYPFPVAGRVTMKLPINAILLHVSAQPPLEPDPRYQTACLWALVDPESPVENRTFHIYGTGHDISQPELLSFVGTWQMGHLVWHLFEQILPKVKEV